MPGQGKYTVYAPVASARNTLLNKLFRGNTTVTNPEVDLVGKETDAREQVVARAKEFLTVEKQQGDPGLFPNGVNLGYTGDQNGVSVPDLTKVVWDSAGDPANAYMPDPTSPGPGTTDPLAKSSDPEISVEDIKGGGYVEGGPGTGTKSPSKTSPSVRDSVELGKQTELGFDVHGFG